jgi:predicted lysophospholipase L1 biosynthesis ABC-type transport system permease subunit
VLPLPDFADLHRQRQQHRHVTQQLLWEEYRQSNPNGYQYSRFCELYRRWRRKQDVVLRDIVLLPQPGAHISDAQIRRAVASADPNLPVISIHTLEDQVSAVFRNQRLLARLTSFFGLLSLLLASIGLYGLTAYNAAQRTSEIGIRMALGADRPAILKLVLRGALTLIAIGLAVGIPLSLAAGKFLGAQLYGTNPYNPLVLTISLAALALSALIAALLPALRASSISLLNALHTE